METPKETELKELPDIFEPIKDSGIRYTISEGRFVDGFQGNKDDVLIIWESNGKTTSVRLTQAAARHTMFVLMHLTRGFCADKNAPIIA